MRKYYSTELLQQLSIAFGPSGCENNVSELIISQIDNVCDAYCTDRVGNVIAKICGKGIDYNEEDPVKVMVSAHMDEVGFMVTDITEDGYLKFSTLGGINPRVMCGRNVEVGDENGRVKGVVATKAIHMQTSDEKGKVIGIDKMYIDIGAVDREDAKKYVSVGDVGTFDSDFVRFGKDGCKLKGKALDDRLGCAAMIEVMREIKNGDEELPYDVYFCFTCCEEIGISGAAVASQSIEPDIAIVLEATAVSDIADVPDDLKVAAQGEGGAISFMDNGTVYDRQFVSLAMKIAENKGIKAQIKSYVSGANDASHIQRSGKGTKVLAISAPARYIHSASCVVDAEDYESVKSLVYALISDGKI